MHHFDAFRHSLYLPSSLASLSSLFSLSLLSCFSCSFFFLLTHEQKEAPDVRFQKGEKWKQRSAVMPVLLHGDASMFQGSVREAFGLTNLKDYASGGTVHIVINNQIGFTTLPKQADSAVHCTDVAKITGIVEEALLLEQIVCIHTVLSLLHSLPTAHQKKVRLFFM
jgi:hypothetical protein